MHLWIKSNAPTIQNTYCQVEKNISSVYSEVEVRMKIREKFDISDVI